MSQPLAGSAVASPRTETHLRKGTPSGKGHYGHGVKGADGCSLCGSRGHGEGDCLHVSSTLPHDRRGKSKPFGKKGKGKGFLRRNILADYENDNWSWYDGWDSCSYIVFEGLTVIEQLSLHADLLDAGAVSHYSSSFSSWSLATPERARHSQDTLVTTPTPTPPGVQVFAIDNSDNDGHVTYADTDARSSITRSRALVDPTVFHQQINTAPLAV